ncbi:hypothetical protein SNEBB_008162 [Seison nebaliae]|nr:hypothetical protein SNEBB_008162 [Seison nebaliae]
MKCLIFLLSFIAFAYGRTSLQSVFCSAHPNGILPHFTICEKYYDCASRSLKTCPSGQAFDVKSKGCIARSAVGRCS